jgi:hypothetical protein
MTLIGWILMGVSWGVILGLFIYCLAKIFRTRKENIRAPLEIETND